MSDWHEEIQALRARTGHNLSQFLHTELRTCSVTLEMARLQLDLHNIAAAQKEYRIAERGLSTLDHFLPKAPEVATEIDAQVKQLRDSLAALGVELGIVA
jgi:hypothetical protein